MDSVRTHQELLLDLAGNGDPTAFYTLVAQFANAAYISKRNLGKSHKEALSILIPFFKAAYQDFIKTSPHKAFDSWYREYKRKYFADTSDSSEEVNLPKKTDVENIPIADIAHFDHILDLILQRKYGKIKKKWNRRLTGQSRQFIQLAKIASIVVSAAIVFILFYFFLSITKQQIILTYVFRHTSMCFTLPFSSNTPLIASGSAVKKPITQDQFSLDSLKKSSNIIHDTLIIHDTVRILRRLTGALKSKTTAVASPGNADVTSPISKPPTPSAIESKPDVPSPSIPPAIQGTIKTDFDSMQ